MLVAGYTWLGGMNVLSGQALGMFLADISIFMSITQSWTMIFNRVIEMNTVLPGLERVVILLNLQTTLPSKEIYQKHLLASLHALEASMVREPNQVFHDSLPLFVKNVQFSMLISSTTNVTIRHSRISLSGDFVVQQGTMVAVVGPRAGGKGTLLKLLNGETADGLSNPEGVFVPPYLRVVHVSSSDSFIFRDSLYSNLTLLHGDAPLEEQRMDRVLNICKRVGMSPDLLEQVRQTSHIFCWDQVLSESDRAQICLARALIDNPDVLLINKPAQRFDSINGSAILDQLKLFVQNRGLDFPEDSLHLRRPKTCIFTTARGYGTLIADKVYNVDGMSGCREISHDEITD
eukprot:TRINITY_DN77040_c0_g1_i1.p1 TRINITY_DN77040_c0_g1~~TRINITY_DN77040_c0_g1_i1.p1  ORF type:complete len:347 (-),score=30.18 TRINITY_DN77040_c0_g1_i1:37-1077(-)